jgi:hypothetical protein
VVPENNVNLVLPGPKTAVLRETLSVPGPHLLTTCGVASGAGFYDASAVEPLPFAFGAVPPEKVAVYEFKPHEN